MRSLIIALALVASACGDTTEPAQPAAPETTYEVDIRWTSYGIPHVSAEDWGSLGYGFAYATATDAICVIAKDVQMVNGNLSRHFGPDEGHLESDVFHRAILTDDKLAGYAAAQSERANEFATGYVAGGISPLGQRKQHPTFIDESAEICDEIYVSGGQRGVDVSLAPGDLVSVLGATYAPLT